MKSFWEYLWKSSSFRKMKSVGIFIFQVISLCVYYHFMFSATLSKVMAVVFPETFVVRGYPVVVTMTETKLCQVYFIILIYFSCGYPVVLTMTETKLCQVYFIILIYFSLLISFAINHFICYIYSRLWLLYF